MIRNVCIALGSLALVAGAPALAAAPCKDAHGKFMKCPPAKAPVKAAAARCRLHGKFAKCGTPGAKPA